MRGGRAGAEVYVAPYLGGNSTPRRKKPSDSPHGGSGWIVAAEAGSGRIRGLTAAGVELGNARPLSRGEVSQLRQLMWSVGDATAGGPFDGGRRPSRTRSVAVRRRVV